MHGWRLNLHNISTTSPSPCAGRCCFTDLEQRPGLPPAASASRPLPAAALPRRSCAGRPA